MQLDRDIAALRHRLDEVPREIAREQEAICRRYSSPQSRLFPAVVTIIVPSTPGR